MELGSSDERTEAALAALVCAKSPRNSNPLCDMAHNALLRIKPILLTTWNFNNFAEPPIMARNVLSSVREEESYGCDRRFHTSQNLANSGCD